MHESLQFWSNFYLLTGTAAATLIGLMFIAMTFGSKLITAETAGSAKSILSAIMNHFIHIFLLACMALVPQEGTMFFGIVALTLGALRLVRIPAIAAQLVNTKKQGHPIEVSDWVYSVILPTGIFLLFIVCGIALTQGSDWALNGIGFLAIGLLTLGIVSAWEMLVWMASAVSR